MSDPVPLELFPGESAAEEALRLDFMVGGRVNGQLRGLVATAVAASLARALVFFLAADHDEARADALLAALPAELRRIRPLAAAMARSAEIRIAAAEARGAALQ